MGRRAWLIGLVLYALGATADFSSHLIGDLRSGHKKMEFPEIVVAFSAGLFWPIDIIAMSLLARL